MKILKGIIVAALILSILSLALYDNSVFAQQSSDVTVRVMTDKPKYLLHDIVVISGEVSEKGKPIDETISLVIKNLETDETKELSIFSKNGTFSESHLNFGEPGTYKINATIQGRSVSAVNTFNVQHFHTTNVGIFLIIGILSLVGYLITNSLTLKEGVGGIAERGTLRFVFITLIAASSIAIFIATDVEVGQNSPIGLVIQEKTGEKDGKEVELSEWIISVGGSYHDNYKSGLQIPVFVFIFGMLGGYLRFLHITTQPWLIKRLEDAYRKTGLELDKAENKEILKAEVNKSLKNAHAGIFDDPTLKRVIFNKSMEDIGLLFLSPLLAMATYFILVQGGIDAIQEPFTLAVISFAIGLATDKAVYSLERFAGGILGSKKDEEREKELETKIGELEGKLMEKEEKTSGS